MTSTNQTSSMSNWQRNLQRKTSTRKLTLGMNPKYGASAGAQSRDTGTKPCGTRSTGSTKDQPEHFIFTDRKGRLIGENELTGVDGETENPLQIEIFEAVDEELAAQPAEEDQHQEADLGNEPEIWS